MTKPARANESARLRQSDKRAVVDTRGGKGGGKVSGCSQLVLGKVNPKHIGQVQDRSAIGVWRISPGLGDIICR